MSEEHRNEQAAPVTAAPRDLSPETERIFVRMTIWQTVIGLAGVFIGLVALWAALQESEAVRRQTAAAVWPIVQFIVVDGADAEGPSFALRFVNAGVGPARMGGMRLMLAGEPVRTWDELLEAAGAAPETPVRRWGVQNLVLRPSEELDVFATRDPVLVATLQEAVADPESAIEYCYCSIFDECWYADARGSWAGPEAVGACPDFGDDAFRS